MLLYLAGVNEHAVLRIVGSKRWSVAHFRRTIQYLFAEAAQMTIYVPDYDCWKSSSCATRDPPVITVYVGG
jgi:hypothetical protein